MTGQNDESPQDVGKEKLWSESQRRATARQLVRLKNGYEMRASSALSWLDILRRMQDGRPEQFGALLAMVKPSGAKHLLGEEAMTPGALTGLRNSGVIRPDGTVNPDIVAVLDASYHEPESGDGAVLRDPIVHPDRTHAQNLEGFEEDTMKRFFDEFRRDPGRT